MKNIINRKRDCFKDSLFFVAEKFTLVVLITIGLPKTDGDAFEDHFGIVITTIRPPFCISRGKKARTRY